MAEFSTSLKSFIDGQKWTFARTMPEWPHEYIVRRDCCPQLFEALVQHIRANGYLGSFYARPITYFDDGGMVYWTMGAPMAETTIINRCRKQDSYEERVRTGNLPGSE